MAKAAAAVANSSSSPVKELRDLSAMDAFRSRSISVSEHAVRRLDKSLLGNQAKKKQKNNNNPNICCFLHGMVDGVSGHCHGGPLGGLAQGTPGAGGACWRKVCVSVCFGAAILHVLSHILFCRDLLLHALFAEDVGKRRTLSCPIFALTQSWTFCFVLGFDSHVGRRADSF